MLRLLTVLKIIRFFIPTILMLLTLLTVGCQNSKSTTLTHLVPHEVSWGIYELDLETSEVRVIYSSPDEIQGSALRLNSQGNRFLFAQKTGGTSDNNLEIYSIGTDGQNLTRLTENQYMDVYPAWSPDDSRVAFLTLREGDLDIYMMDANGGDATLYYDSGSHDGDIDWAGDCMVFTSGSAIWKLEDNGVLATCITDPPHRGEWGEANLPAGDYDPRLSPDGSKIVFERLEDTAAPNGGYNFFVINVDGTGETRLTDTDYAQGLANWSRAGDHLVYVVAAIDGKGIYDIYMMNADGTDNRNITPDYFPPDFLCHSPVFSADDSKIYFIGQWWE